MHIALLYAPGFRLYKLCDDNQNRKVKLTPQQRDRISRAIAFQTHINTLSIYIYCIYKAKYFYYINKQVIELYYRARVLRTHSL